MCFNSLQTGKCIQRQRQVHRDRPRCFFVSIPFKRESVFRGKVFTIAAILVVFVSIPFKRESVFRVNGDGYIDDSELKSCFNSLQTGKCIQRQPNLLLQEAFNAFQFPSNGKVYSESTQKISKKEGHHVFQFPSNGKVYSERF